MNKLTFTQLILTTISSLFIWSCGGGSIGEPNNTIDKANAVKLNEPINMKIHEKKDVDWYSVELPGQGYLKIMTKNIPEELVPQAALAVYEEWQGNEGEYLKSWTNLPCAMAIPKAGTYHIAIIDDYNDAMSDSEFEVKFEFVNEFDDFETNNNPKNAKQVEAGKEYKSAIYPTGDQDWFKINVESQGYLTIKAKNINESIVAQTRFVKYDEYKPDDLDVVRDYGKLPRSVSIIKPGEYYFQLLDDYNDQESDQLFDWVIEFTPEFDTNEPNNKFEDAKELTENDTLNLAIFPEGDVDIYKVNVNSPCKLNITAKDYEEIVPQVKLSMKDTTGTNELIEIGDWQNIPAEIEIPDTINTYFIKFIDDYSDAEFNKTFSVKIEKK